MKKLHLRWQGLMYLLILQPFFSHAQTPKISTSFPNIISPSPTVSGLMKFEEMPVNNYTGIPNISVPIYSIQTRSSDIAINLSLNYHPSSIAVNEIASYTGLGWNLMAGGTIARTVRGLPDEHEDIQKHRYGLYILSENNYDQVNAIRDIVGNIDAPHSVIAEEYLWEAVEKGKFDTEYDIYQYNFMGYTGRFYMRRTSSGYQVIPLNNDNTISISYNGDHFVLTDDKGYKYVFDVKETTNVNTTSATRVFGGGLTPELETGGVTNLNYISAYHLSAIEDNTNVAAANRLATFIYNPMVCNEIAYNVTEVKNKLVAPDYDQFITIFNNGCDFSHFDKIEPELIQTMTRRMTGTRKLQRIEIPNKAKIDFTIEGGRLDQTLQNNGRVADYRLKEIAIRDWAGLQVKKFSLIHSYLESKQGNIRMVLDKFIENDLLTYNFSYASSDESSYSEKLGIDHWGFLNKKPKNVIGNYLEASSSVCATDVLSSMQLPTGGFVNYEFEANDYSYIGDIRLEDFSENPDRFIEVSDQVMLDQVRKLSPNANTPFFIIQDKQRVKFTASGASGINWNVKVCGYNFTSPNMVAVSGNNCPLYCFATPELEPNHYFAYFESFDLNLTNPNCYVTVDYVKRNPLTYDRKYLIGGGIRIKTISYTDKNKEVGRKTYNYDMDNEKRRSSGSLAFPKPVYKYYRSIQHRIQRTDCKLLDQFVPSSVQYETTTTFDNLKPINTQGAYVGYKNVTVSQVGYIEDKIDVGSIIEKKNGKIVYTYTSPIEVPLEEYQINYQATPNLTYAIPYPFVAPVNRDYKRGILKNEKYYDEYNKLLMETIYEHKVIEDFKITGIRPYSTSECPWAKYFTTYDSYVQYQESCQDDYNKCRKCGDPSSYLFSNDVKEAYGWVQLTGKTSKNYFYDKQNNLAIVITKENFDYNTTNKLISNYSKEYYKQAGLLSEKIEERYVYMNTTNNISKILFANSYVNGEQTSYQGITYLNTLSTGNSDMLPSTVGNAKGTGALETKLRYRKYDIFGSPVELLRENDIPVVYIYDRNHHNPIAMIQNATYAQVESVIGSPDSQLGYSEENMAALNGLRTVLPSAIVTTYTYKPLIGVATVTDPRGRVTKYEYDNFGRLIRVRDHDNFIISENNYKYSIQN